MLIALAAVLVIGAVVGTAGAYAIVRGREAIAAIFGLNAEPSRPRGVQEDDAPPRWKLIRPGT